MKKWMCAPQDRIERGSGVKNWWEENNDCALLRSIMLDVLELLNYRLVVPLQLYRTPTKK